MDLVTHLGPPWTVCWVLEWISEARVHLPRCRQRKALRGVYPGLGFCQTIRKQKGVGV